MSIAGRGRTHALKGVGVIESGVMTSFTGGILDMVGPGTELTHLSNLHHIVLITEPSREINQADYSRALKMAGLKAATYVASASLCLPPDEVRVYEIAPLNESSEKSALPRIAYVYITDSHESLKEPFIYGDNPRNYFPTIFHPNEFLDGAIVSCAYNSNPGLRPSTYSLQNSPVIEGLYRRHGKELIFAGVIAAPAHMALADKKRSALLVAKLARFGLAADGVIIAKEGAGHLDINLMECCEQCELLGIKTCLIGIEMLSPDGIGSAMLAFSKLADCVVSVGNMDEKIGLPPVETVIGGEKIGPDVQGPADGPIGVPACMFPDAVSPVGLTKTTTEEI